MQMIKDFISIFYQLISQMDLGRQPQILRNTELDYQPVPYSMLAFIDKFLTTLGLANCRTRNCEHRGTCIGSMLVSMLKTGMTAYGIKTLISLFFSLKKVIKSPKAIIKVVGDKNSLRFGLFISTFIFIFRSLLCLARRSIRKEQEKYIYLSAGFIGGTLSVMFM